MKKSGLGAAMTVITVISMIGCSERASLTAVSPQHDEGVSALLGIQSVSPSSVRLDWTTNAVSVSEVHLFRQIGEAAAFGELALLNNHPQYFVDTTVQAGVPYAYYITIVYEGDKLVCTNRAEIIIPNRE